MVHDLDLIAVDREDALLAGVGVGASSRVVTLASFHRAFC